MEVYPAKERKPISELISNQDELSKLLDNFDMYREIASRNLSDAIKYAYIEHLMRISTSLSESRASLQAFPKNQQAKLQALLENRNENLQSSLHNLEKTVTFQDLNSILPIIKSINYRWDGRKLAIEELDYQSEGLTPICYTLSMNQINYILYTPNMTYVDGFDPFTGEKKIPIIPEDMLKIYSKKFCVLSKVRSMQCQTDFDDKKGKKKHKRELTKESIEKIERPSLTQEASGVGIKDEKIEELPREITIKEEAEEPKIEEFEVNIISTPPKTKTELVNLEEKGTTSEEESESEEDLSSDEEGSTTFHTGGPRTWEKYDRQAAKRQRTKDQCAPLNGCILL